MACVGMYTTLHYLLQQLEALKRHAEGAHLCLQQRYVIRYHAPSCINGTCSSALTFIPSGSAHVVLRVTPFCQWPLGCACSAEDKLSDHMGR